MTYGYVSVVQDKYYCVDCKPVDNFGFVWEILFENKY